MQDVIRIPGFSQIKMQIGNSIRRGLSKFVGATGTNIYSGYITDEDLTTIWDETTTRAVIVREMIDQDSVISSTLAHIKTPILQAKARIVPVSDDSDDVKIADFVSACLFENPFFGWYDWLTDALRYLDFGYEVMEKAYVFSPEGHELFEGKMVWNFEHRKPETIRQWFLKDKTNPHIVQDSLFVDGETSTWKQVPIALERVYHIANDMEGDNYMGRSILRSAYRAYKIKGLLIRLDAIKAERYGVPMPRGKMTGVGSEAELKAALKAFRSNEEAYLIQTNQYEIDIMETGNTGVDMIPSIKLQNEEIRSHMMQDFLSLGKANVGAKSLGETFKEPHEMSIGSIITNIEDSMNRGRGEMHNIKQLVDLNFANVKQYPKLSIDRPGADKTRELIAMVKDLAPMKAITLDNEIENKLRVFGGLSELEDDEEIDRGQSGHEVDDEDLKELRARIEPLPADTVKWWADQGVTFPKKPDEWANPVIMQHREPTELEAAILNIDMIENRLDEVAEKLEDHNIAIREKMTKEMVDRGIKIASKPNATIKDIEDLIDNFQVPFTRDLGNEIVALSKDMFQFGRETMIEEIAKQEKKKVSNVANSDAITLANHPPPLSDTKQIEDAIRPLVNTEVGSFTNKILDEWKTIVLEMFLAGTITASLLRDRLNRVSQGKFDLMAKHMANRGFGLGRMLETLKAKDKISFMVRSEILDDRLCPPCARINNKKFKIGSPTFAQLAPGPNPKCLGASSCRGLNIAVVK